MDVLSYFLVFVIAVKEREQERNLILVLVCETDTSSVLHPTSQCHRRPRYNNQWCCEGCIKPETFEHGKHPCTPAHE